MMTTKSFMNYLITKFPPLAEFFINGAVNRNADKSIGILMASEYRSKNSICLGGLDCTVISMLPVNIVVRWTNNAEECNLKANEIYATLLSEAPNITVNDSLKIASIELIDGNPVGFSRDDKNICEVVIRCDVFYYLNRR